MVKRSVDYAFKSKVLREHADIVKRQNKASYYEYCKRTYENDGIVLVGLKNSDKESLDDLYIECCFNGLHDEFMEAQRINDAYYKRLKRLRERVKTILQNGDCVFLTLTFTDGILESTTPKSRRVAVSRYLKQYNAQYVANIDFGAKNHREHYHALISTSQVDRNGWKKFGAINFEPIRHKWLESDAEKLTKYINKLTNHAIKETTKRSALMYSR